VGEPSFSQQLQSTAELQVDVAHLDQIKKYLEQVAQAVEDALLPKLRQLDQDFGYGRGEGGSALGSLQIDNVPTLKERHDSTHRAVKASVERMVTSYREAARVIGEFAADYDTVEERNRASAAALTWKA
jgi:hypothetical protein